MTLELIFDFGLAALVLAVATWTLVARETTAAVIGFVAYGLLLTLVWVRLAAVDVALTEAAIGSGMTGVLLLTAAARLRATEAVANAEQPGATLRVVAALLCVSVFAGLAGIVLWLPEPAPTLAPQAAANLPATGLGNPVTAVLLAYRAIDTLLETVVLLLALLGVWSLAPDRVWGGRPGPRSSVHRDGVLTFLAQLLPPVGIVVAIHLFWVGADAPGGKFQAATILAAMWILAQQAGLTDAPPVDRRWLRLVLVAGPAAFLAVGFLGFAAAGAFLAYPAGYAKPLILFIEAALMPSIAATLALLVAGPPARTEPP
jgi:multisubunit Na+/H+ antiporter MnhB subunit